MLGKSLLKSKQKMATLRMQTVKSIHKIPRNKPMSSYFSLTQYQEILRPKSSSIPSRWHHALCGQRVWGPSHHTHRCPRWQTSQASWPRTEGPLLLQACVPASRGRRSGPNPAWTCEVPRCSCNALLLDITKGTRSSRGRRRESTELRGGSPKPHVYFTWLLLRKPALLRDLGKPEDREL